MYNKTEKKSSKLAQFDNNINSKQKKNMKPITDSREQWAEILVTAERYY